MTVGNTPVPPGFPYREVLLKGRPQHAPTDPFRIRHPVMDVGKRAKIFAPFDALRGFREALTETERRENGGPEASEASEE